MAGTFRTPNCHGFDLRFYVSDFIQSLATTVRDAATKGDPLCIQGGNTKQFLGREPLGKPCPVSGYAGVVNYEPTELVITAKAGTRLVDIEATLARAGQMLPFEPPGFGVDATIGGTIACGLSGPARPYRGAARDLVLGITCINGKGQILKFGGQVMKNVAGYDVSRLMVGSMGTLGIMTEISLKVLPVPKSTKTLVFECSSSAALKKMTSLFARSIPVTASAWHDDLLRIRLSGVKGSIDAASAKLGGDVDPDGDQFWQKLKEHRLDFFNGPGSLWRLSLKPKNEVLPLTDPHLIEWGGGLYWVKSSRPPSDLMKIAASAGGYITRFNGGDRSENLSGLDGVGMRLNQQLKKGFDPHNILNPGRLFV